MTFTIFALLLFFPSVTFGLLSAEIFPWAVLFSLAYLRKITASSSFLLILLLLSTFYTSFQYALNPLIVQKDILRSFFAYLNIVLIYVTILQLPQSKVNYMVMLSRRIFYGLIGLGCLQFSGLVAPLDPIFSALVPRASSTALLEMGGRGVTLLASEPARAGIELTLIYVIFRMATRNSTRITFWDIFLPIFIALVIRSASASAFAIFVVMILTVRSRKSLLLWLPVILLSPLAPLGMLEGRTFDLVMNIASRESAYDIMFFIANESGHRLLALYSFIKSGLTHPFGSGIGNWLTSSMQAIEESGIDYSTYRYFQVWGGGQLVPVRAPGVIPNMILDIGIVGAFYFIYWILKITAPFKTSYRDFSVIMIILFVKITMFGSLGTPVPWVITALALRWRPEESNPALPTGLTKRQTQRVSV